MTEQYNLNDNVSESFSFELDGAKYVMRYPTLEEMEKLQKIIKEYPDDNEKVMVFLYSYIKPQEGAKDIKTVMSKHNIQVLRNFTKMIKVEFGIEE